MTEMEREEQFAVDIRKNKVKEGFLVKRSRILKEWRVRWVILTSSRLYSFEDKKQLRRPTQSIELNKVTTLKTYYQGQYEKEHILRVESADTFFYLSAESHQVKWSWLSALEKVIYHSVSNEQSQTNPQLVRETIKLGALSRMSSRVSTLRLSTISPLNKDLGEMGIVVEDKKPSFRKNTFVANVGTISVVPQHNTQNTHTTKEQSNSEDMNVTKLKQLYEEEAKVRNKNAFIKSSAEKQEKNVSMQDKAQSKVVTVQKIVYVDRVVQKIVYVQKQPQKVSSELLNKVEVSTKGHTHIQSTTKGHMQVQVSNKNHSQTASNNSLVPRETRHLLQQSLFTQHSFVKNLLQFFQYLVNRNLLEKAVPFLHFIIFMGLLEVEQYTTLCLQFSTSATTQRFLSEILLYRLNEGSVGGKQVQCSEVESDPLQIDDYLRYIIVLYEGTTQYFYASDVQILLNVLMRQLEYSYSQVNMYLNMQVMRVLLVRHGCKPERMQDLCRLVKDVSGVMKGQHATVANEILELLI